MENISTVKIWRRSHVPPLSVLLLLSGTGFSGAAFGQSYVSTEAGYQMAAHSPETPSSPHVLHLLKSRTFSVSISRSSEDVEESNGDSSATFAESASTVTAAFGRAVSPSVGLGLTLVNTRSHSSFSEVDGSLTNDVIRDVQSSIGLADASFKIMDTVVFGLRLGTQLSRLEFSGSDSEKINIQHWGPAIAWKSDSFELAAYRSNRHLRLKDVDGTRLTRQYSESGLTLTDYTDGKPTWMVWLQKNPLNTCCAFTDSNRVVYGGRMFFSALDWNLAPGYRYLSEFSDDSSPGSIEDPARHSLFFDGVTNWYEWLPGLHLSYEQAARKTGPSSFRSGASDRSDYTLNHWSFSGTWGRSW